MERAEVSREVNRQIAEMSSRLDGAASLDVRFLCECGCLSWVTMTASQYVDGGAWYGDHAVRMPKPVGGLSRRD